MRAIAECFATVRLAITQHYILLYVMYSLWHIFNVNVLFETDSLGRVRNVMKWRGLSPYCGLSQYVSASLTLDVHDTVSACIFKMALTNEGAFHIIRIWAILVIIGKLYTRLYEQYSWYIFCVSSFRILNFSMFNHWLHNVFSLIAKFRSVSSFINIVCYQHGVFNDIM